MGTVITVTSGKGGVGKSTTAANVAVGLAKSGKRVVAVDFDIGLRNLDMILGLENRIVYDLIDVIEKRCNLSQALINDKRAKDLYFLPASQTRDKTALKKDKVEELIESLKKDFDYIMLDSPAGIESGFENAIFLADQALIIATPDVSSVRDADRVIGIIDAKSKKAKNGEEVSKKIVINRLKPEMVESGEMMSINDILNILALPLVGVIPEDSKIISATNVGEPIIYDKNSLAGEAFRRLSKRILGEKTEFLDLKSKKGFVNFLRGLFK